MSEQIAIGCRMVSGVHLRVNGWISRVVDDPEYGHKTVTVPIESGVIELKGTGAMPRPSAYAVSHVPKDLWDSWLRENEHSQMVKNGVVFAIGDTA